MASAGAGVALNGVNDTLSGINVRREYFSRGVLVASFVLNGVGHKQDQGAKGGGVVSYAYRRFLPALSLVNDIGANVVNDFMGLPGFRLHAYCSNLKSYILLERKSKMRATVIPQAGLK